MKFGIEITKTIKEAKEMDIRNGTCHWVKSIDREFKNIRKAFRIPDEDTKIPVGSTKITYGIIFDVKFDLTRKSRVVANGYKNYDVSSHITYASVVSRESERIMFLLAALNNIEVLDAADIAGAYLNAPFKGKFHVMASPELFGIEYDIERMIGIP